MSLDANYILSYDVQHYIGQTPMERDIEFLKEKFGGYFTIFDRGYSVYYEKPKYILLPEVFETLLADQILEKKDCEQWRIVK